MQGWDKRVHTHFVKERKGKATDTLGSCGVKWEGDQERLYRSSGF